MNGLIHVSIPYGFSLFGPGGLSLTWEAQTPLSSTVSSSQRIPRHSQATWEMLSLQSVSLPQWDVPRTPHHSSSQEASGSSHRWWGAALLWVLTRWPRLSPYRWTETSYHIMSLVPDTPTRAFLAENHSICTQIWWVLSRIQAVLQSALKHNNKCGRSDEVNRTVSSAYEAIEAAPRCVQMWWNILNCGIMWSTSTNLQQSSIPSG